MCDAETDPQVKGRWTPLFQLPNVPVHATLLPNGKVLHWGRRNDPTKSPQDPSHKIACLDEHFTKSFLWSPAPGDPVKGRLGTSEAIKDEHQPTYYNPRDECHEHVNLFCSGHCLLPNGNLLVTGGHWNDGFGVEQTSVFDYQNSKWIPQTLMNNGRWYPSVLALPDGRMLCISGSDNGNMDPNVNSIPQIYSTELIPSNSTTAPRPTNWTEVVDPVPQGLLLDLFPRVHIDPTNGQVFMAGPKAESWFLEIKDAKGSDIKDAKGVVGRWTKAGTSRFDQFRDYAPSVMYASGKIMYIGGGTADGRAGQTTEFIDLNKKPVKWETERVDLNNARKQFNATILPDGTVLATGGTSGGGFNDLDSTVHHAELMDPSVEPKVWVEMAAEIKSRAYHSTALLLPDGRVLSAGGGEYGGCSAEECHTEAQLFEPPYFFKNRPTILSAPDVIEYNEDFSVMVGNNDNIKGANLIRLGSVTHCRNFSQQLVSLELKQEGTKVTLHAPENSNVAPPGHYMLFVLSECKIPSEAAIIRIAMKPSQAGVADTRQTRVEEQSHPHIAAQDRTATTAQVQSSLVDHSDRIKAEQDKDHVVVGLTPLCPYGLGPCWGGAHDGLQAVSEIDVVRPTPHHSDCLAFVYLKEDTLPDIDVWREEFKQVANQGYTMRGIEMTISGSVTKEVSGTSDQLMLAATPTRSEVILAPFREDSQLKWDIKTQTPRPIADNEAKAYERLVAASARNPANNVVRVTGTLQKHGNGKFSLDVRDFEFPNHASGVNGVNGVNGNSR